MAYDYTLTLRSSPVDLSSKTATPTPIDGGMITNLEGVRDTWRRNITWYGGCDVGEFEVHGTKAQLNEWFQTWLGLDIIEESMGIITWNGIINEIEYHTGGMPKRHSLARMHNSVKVIYNGGEDETLFVNNTESQAIYGKREHIIQPEVYTPAQALIEQYYHLRRYGWPPFEPFTSNRQPGDSSYLKVYCTGYKWTLNNLYVKTTGLGWIYPTRSSAITSVIGSSQYVTARSIETNTQEISGDVDDEKAWDFIVNLLGLSDNTYHIFRGWIDCERYFYYASVDTSLPDYYIVNGEVRTEASASAQIINPRQLQPGIYRDMDWPLWGEDRNYFLSDRADILVQNITVDENGMLQYNPVDSSVGDVFARYTSRENEESDYLNEYYQSPAGAAMAENYPEMYEYYSDDPSSWEPGMAPF